MDEAKLRLEARCMASRDPNFAPRHTASLLSTHTHTPLSDSGSPIPGREISKESPGITCPQISLSPFQKVPRSSAKYAPVLAPKPKPLSMTPSFLAPDREGATKLGCYLAVGQWATLPKYTSMTLFSGWFPRLHPGLSPYLVEDLLQVGRAHAVSQVAVGRVGEEELAFSSQGSCDIFLTIDVLLASVHDSNVACGWGGGQGAFSLAGSEGLEVKGKGYHVGQGHGRPTSAQREQLVFQNIAGICALIHQVQLSDDPDGALTWVGRMWQERAVYTCTRPHTEDPRHSRSHHTPSISQPSPSFTHCLPVPRPPFILHGGPNDF